MNMPTTREGLRDALRSTVFTTLDFGGGVITQALEYASDNGWEFDHRQRERIEEACFDLLKEYQAMADEIRSR